MPVVFYFNDNVIKPSLLAIWSLLMNTTLPHIKMYIMIDERLSEGSKQKVTDLCNRFGDKVDLTFLYMPDYFYSIVPINDLNRWVTENPLYGIDRTSEYRVFLPQILKDEDECAFFDSDIYFARNMDEFLTTPVKEGCAVEFAKHYRTNSDQYMEWIAEHNLPNKYVNVGVGKFNLKLWRDLNLYDTVIEVFKGPALKRWEQDLFNIYFYDYIGNFELKYNSGNHVRSCEPGDEKYNNYIEDCGKEEFEEARNNPVIYHFSGPYKPWKMEGDNFWKQEYRKYREFMGEN